MNDSKIAQLQSVVKTIGLRFTAEKDHFLIHFGNPGRPLAMGFRLVDNTIVSAFVCPSWVCNDHADLAADLVACLNRYMPVGAWTSDDGSGRVRYTCRLPVPQNPKQRLRFFASFLHRQVELMKTCCNGIEVAGRSHNISKTHRADHFAMGRFQPMAESLPPGERVTACQWNRAMKALRIDAECEPTGCQSQR
jgi:hypothetical protein